MLLGELVAVASSKAPDLGWSSVGPASAWAVTEITGLALDSRVVQPGDLFFCVPGGIVDGHDFAAAAVSAGAGALVVDRALALAVPQVLATNVRAAMARLSCAYHGDPSRSLTMVGITGTNGKTTTAALVEWLLAAAGIPTATIGTLTGVRTTPEAPHLQGALRGLVDAGTRAVAMEVSSHALAQQRVTGTHFDVGVFTNLTPDHLDYHRDLEDYFEAKAMLFRPEFVDAAVINVDDPHGRVLAARVTVPVTPVSRRDIDLLDVSLTGSRLRWHDREITIAIPGLFNIDNALAAAAAAGLVGVDDATIARALESVPAVPGRFEVVSAGAPAPVTIVDYAHTPDGIDKILRSVRAIAPDAEITIVFGCGGDRDRAKRPLMAAAAEAQADRVVLTSDNPRSEDPAAIIAAVMTGFSRPESVEIEPDRAAAIEHAIRTTPPSGVVVVAGKGAETTQTIGPDEHPFDDRVVAAAAIDSRVGGTT